MEWLVCASVGMEHLAKRRPERDDRKARAQQHLRGAGNATPPVPVRIVVGARRTLAALSAAVVSVLR